MRPTRFQLLVPSPDQCDFGLSQLALPTFEVQILLGHSDLVPQLVRTTSVPCKALGASIVISGCLFSSAVINVSACTMAANIRPPGVGPVIFAQRQIQPSTCLSQMRVVRPHLAEHQFVGALLQTFDLLQIRWHRRTAVYSGLSHRAESKMSSDLFIMDIRSKFYCRQARKLTEKLGGVVTFPAKDPVGFTRILVMVGSQPSAPGAGTAVHTVPLKNSTSSTRLDKPRN